MRQFLTIILILIGILPVMSQNEDEQVLVFRNTGEVNLFYSAEIDSIVCSHFDNDNVWHEEYVSQVFYAKDTTLLVPLAEVDSVCFGNRNEVVFHSGVHQISEPDIEWLIRYEDNHLFFRGDTPDNVLPKMGEKLFAQQYKPKLPLGICAQVDNAAMIGGEWVVTIHDVELSDIFVRLFYAGALHTEEPKAGSQQRAPILHSNFEGIIRVEEIGSVAVDFDFDLDGRAVVHPLEGYYNFEADVVNSYSSTFAFGVMKECTLGEKNPLVTIPLGVYALVFTPELKINLFLDLDAELSIDATFGHETTSHISYVKRRGEDAVFAYTGNGNSADDPFSRVDVTFDGEVFGGIETVFDFNVLRELAGAKLKFKLGPSLKGEFGLGLLNRATTYTPEVYNKAQLKVCAMTKVEGTVYTKNLFADEENEHEVFHLERRFFERALDLFPNFFDSRAVQGPPTQQSVTEVTTATKTDSKMLREVEMGFQLLDEQEKVTDSVFVGLVQPNMEVVQGFNTEFQVKKDDAPKLMRPVIHYKGRTIPAATTNVLSNVQIQPVIFAGTNGAVTYVASYPFMGEVTADQVNYRAGAYLPIPVADSVFNDSHTITTLQFLDDNRVGTLFGKWQGYEDDVQVTYIFEPDFTGSLNGKSFTFRVNDPQSGKVNIVLETGETIIMSIVNLQEMILQYRLGKDTLLYTLNRQM